jgi:hypothetical protein
LTDAELAKLYQEGLNHSREHALRAVYDAGFHEGVLSTKPIPEPEVTTYAAEERQVEEDREPEHKRDGSRWSLTKASRSGGPLHSKKK